MDLESSFDKLWLYLREDPAELKSKVFVCLKGHLTEDLASEIGRHISAGNNAAARKCLTECLDNQLSVGEIKRRLDLILHFKERHSHQSQSRRTRVLRKETLLREVDALVSNRKFVEAEELLQLAIQNSPDRDYDEALARLRSLERANNDAPKPIESRPKFLSDQLPLLSGETQLPQFTELPTGADLSFIDEESAQFIGLAEEMVTPSKHGQQSDSDLLYVSQAARAPLEIGGQPRQVEPAEPLHDSRPPDKGQPSQKDFQPPSSSQKQAASWIRADEQPAVENAVEPIRVEPDLYPEAASNEQAWDEEEDSTSLNDIAFLSDDDFSSDHFLESNDSNDLLYSDEDLQELTIHDPARLPAEDLDEPQGNNFYSEDEYGAYAFDPDEVDIDDATFDYEAEDWTNTLSREDRALQKASDLLVKTDWPLSAIGLIQQIFIMSGWGQTRLALEREIEKGLTYEELLLAARIKVVWAENSIYWIALQANGTGSLSHCNLSWPNTLLVVRSFESLPQSEELEVFLESLFEEWYESSRLPRLFRSFSRYLWFRLSDHPDCLPVRQPFSFCNPHLLPAEEYSDLGNYDLLEVEKNRSLHNFGVFQNKHPQEHGCYFSDRPPRDLSEFDSRELSNRDLAQMGLETKPKTHRARKSANIDSPEDNDEHFE